MQTQNNYTKVYKTTYTGIYCQTKQPMEKNWHLPPEIITLNIIYNPDGCILEFSMYIPLQIFAMTAHGIIPVVQIGNKDWAVLP